MSGLPYTPNVTFNAGAPIDIDKLSRLQSNIAAVLKQSESGIQNATLNIQGVQRNLKVIPVVYAGSSKVPISQESKRGYAPIDFTGSNFTEIPIFVASISTNTKPGDQVTLRATATSKTGGEIEVFIGTGSKLTEVTINFVAVQMKQVD